jgi:hypothetical protein
MHEMMNEMRVVQPLSIHAYTRFREGWYNICVLLRFRAPQPPQVPQKPFSRSTPSLIFIVSGQKLFDSEYS